MPGDPTTISLASRLFLSSESLEGMLRDLEPLLSDAPAPVVLDLSAVTFVGPTCLAVLVAACRGAGPGVIGRVIYPENADTRAYLERMDVFDLIPCKTEAATGGRRTPEGFRECRRFVSQDDCVETSRELVGAIAERCELGDTSRRALASCIAEIAENVYFHAESTEGGFAAAQSWPKKSLIEVAIVDLGRGVRRSLMENPAYADIEDDEDAIRRAMQLGVTATPQRNTGQGLFSAARLLEGNGGRVLVRSGSAYVYDGARKESGISHPFPGTLVAMTIRTDRPLDDGAVAQLIGSLKGGDEDPDDLFD